MLQLRSKRQPDAEFARPRADRKCQHASDPNHGNRQRNSGKHTKHQRVQTVRREHFRSHVFESGGVLDGLIGGHVANNARDRRDQGIRICTGMDEKVAAKYGTLFKGGIDGKDGFRNDVFVVNIGSDADDAMRRAANRGESQHGVGPEDVAIDGIVIGEHALCQSLADDDDRLFAFLAVETVEIAPSDDGNAQRGKESGRNDAQLCARILFAWRMNMAVGGELQAEAAISPWDGHSESRLAHTW